MTDIANDASFLNFYHQHFLLEHRHPANISLHILGVLASSALIVACFTVISPLWLFLWPVLFVGLGLVGHRLFERSEAVGDARVMRTDFPKLWFLVGNYLLTVRVLSFGRFF